MKKYTLKTYKIHYLLVLSMMLFTIIFSCAFTEAQKVYDKAGLLSAEQITALQTKAISIANEKKVDIIILTTKNAQGKTAEAYADDFYDQNHFGYEQENGTGILFLIDMDNRKVWISTAGTAITYFTDNRIATIVSSVTGDLKNGEYYKASNLFLDKVSEYMGNPASDSVYHDSNGQAHTDGYFDSQGNFKEYTYLDRFFQNAWIYLIISIVVGIAGAAFMAINSGGRMTVGSGTYIDRASIKVNNSQDQYIKTTVTKRKIETNSGGGGGGSSTHTSSSGETHGGGGGSF